MTVMVASSVRRLPVRCARSPWWKSRRRVVIAGAAAATFSGLPSTLHALATGGDLLQATRAAATLVPGRRGVVAGAAVHVVVSAGWTAALAAVDRRHRLGLLGGGAAGMLIAAFDLEVAGRANPAIRSLPRLPQWLDHVAFGAIVGALLRPCEGIPPDRSSQ
jgi:hypothetical protein